MKSMATAVSEPKNEQARRSRKEQVRNMLHMGIA